MLDKDLFEQALILPATKNGCDDLKIVSGFATASMAARHLDFLTKGGRTGISLNIVVGMGAVQGLARAQHMAFKSLCSKWKNFNAMYIAAAPPIHSKVYVWSREGMPVKAFLGSANYTHAGFGKSTWEVLEETDPRAAKKYYDKAQVRAVDCTAARIEEMIVFVEGEPMIRSSGETEAPHPGTPYVDLPLYDVRRNMMQRRAGLNWGQRPEEGRDPNQAYIPIPKAEREKGILPRRGEYFTILTDDGQSFLSRVAQDDGKAVHSTENNSAFGQYFRNRMGLKSGQPVVMDDLLRYGRKSVRIYKIDDETYYMDFSPNMGPGEE